MGRISKNAPDTRQITAINEQIITFLKYDFFELIRRNRVKRAKTMTEQAPTMLHTMYAKLANNNICINNASKQGKVKQSKAKHQIHTPPSIWMDGWAKEQEPWCESSNQSYSTMRARAQRVEKNYVK